MINNFNQIKELLDFPSDDIFYFIQLIKRRKENPDMTKNEVVLLTHYLTSIDRLNSLEFEIIDFCKTFKTRAYINLNKRSFKKIGLEMLRTMSEYIIQGDYKSIRKAYNSCCGKYSSDENKKWVLDVDFKPDNIELYLKKINEFLFNVEPLNVEKIITKIPTKSGLHIITKPFNPLTFKKIYPEIEIHKNNPTILYIP